MTSISINRSVLQAKQKIISFEKHRVAYRNILDLTVGLFYRCGFGAIYLTGDISVEKVREYFQEHDTRRQKKFKNIGNLTSASVLVPLFKREQEWHVLLTVRADHLRSQAGEVAFPGGKQDEEDCDEIATALREAEEEIGLDPKEVEVIAVLPVSFVRPNNMVSVVVGVIPENFELSVNKNEVQRVFNLPLKRFLKDDYELATFKWENDFVANAYFFKDTIDGVFTQTWGFTAMYCVIVAMIVYQDFQKRYYVAPGLYHTLDGLWTDQNTTLFALYIIHKYTKTKL